MALAVVGSSRERPGHPDRVRLRCPKSFAPSDCSGRTSWWGTSGRTLGYVLVVRPVITGTSAASCHNLPGTKAIRGAHFRLGHRAPGRGGRQARTVSGCLNSAFLGLFSTSCGPSFLAMDTQLGARQDGGPQRAWGVRRGAWGGRTVASEAEGTEITLHASRLTPHAPRPTPAVLRPAPNETNSQRQQSGSKSGQDQPCSMPASGYDRMCKTGVANDRDGKAKHGRTPPMEVVLEYCAL